MEETDEETRIVYRVSPPVTDAALNALFAAAGGGESGAAFTPTHQRSLAYVCAFHGERLVGYVNLVWDGGRHAFLLDTTVHPDFQRRGVGRELVAEAARAAQGRGVEWIHVDYEPPLAPFYAQCGFRPTLAGLIHLDGTGDDAPASAIART